MIDVARRVNALAPLRDLDPWSLPFTRGELAHEVVRIRGSGLAEAVGEGALAGLLAELEEELAPEIASIGSEPEGRGAVTGRAEIDLRARSRDRGALRPIARGDLALRLARSFIWHQGAEVDADGAGDPDFTGKAWEKGITGDFTHAYAAIRFPHGRVTAGRRPIAWGTGAAGTLILQGNAPPLDQVSVDFARGSLSAHAFVASLDDLPGDSLHAPARRWLSGHRLALRIGDRARLAVSETVVYGGPGRGIDWAYANPLLVYYAVDWNRDADDNVLWGADGSFRVHRTLDIYGEFLADDFQYDRKSEPNQIAFLAGLHAKDLPHLGGVFFDAEYARVNNWVYGHDIPWNRYTHGRAVLGHPLGPDADRILLRLLVRRGRTVELLVEHEHRREGEGSIDDPRGSAVPHGTGFLTGEVVKSDLPALEVRWHPRSARRIYARLERDLSNDWLFSCGALFRFAATARAGE